MNQAGADRLNVLLITLDQWRADCIGVAGHPVVQTPNIDRLARDAVRFASHYAVCAPCGPSRASLLTGLYLHNHRSVRGGIPLDARFTNLALEMRRLGYAPKLFGFTDTTADPRDLPEDHPARRTTASMLQGFEPGLDMPGDGGPWLEWLGAKGYPIPASPRDIWRPAQPRDRVDDQPTAFTAEESETAYLTDHAAAFIREQGETAWFAHLSYFRPHHPYIAPEPYNRRYAAEGMPDPVAVPGAVPDHPFLAAQWRRQQAGRAPVQDELPLAGLDAGEIRQLRANYFASVTECDAAIGRLIAALHDAGAWDRTLIVLTSDHGDLLGDHGLWAAEGCFDPAFHVPLIIRDPRPAAAAARGATVEHFTESVDVMPTILTAMGAVPPRQCDGVSLEPWLRGEIPKGWRTAAHWEFDFRDTVAPGLQGDLAVTAEAANLAAVRTTTHKYVHFAGLAPLLFDVADDPDETRDLSGDPAQTARRIDLASELLSWRMRSADRTLTGWVTTPQGVRQID